MTEELVLDSFLTVAQQYELPQIVKTDHDKLWYDGISGLPSHLTRVLSALGVYHLLVGPKQPWWNGVVERYVRNVSPGSRLAVTRRKRCRAPCHGNCPPVL